MVAQFAVERLPALLGEEDARALEADVAPRPRDGGGQPVGPLGVEVDVVGSPDDQRRRLQLPELRLDGDGVSGIERRQEALEVARASGRPEMRLEIEIDGL